MHALDLLRQHKCGATQAGLGVNRFVVVNPNVFGRLPWPCLAPVDVHYVEGNRGKFFHQRAHQFPGVVQENLDRDRRIVTGAWQRRVGIEVVLFKAHPGVGGAAAFGQRNHVRAQIQRRDPHSGIILGEQAGDSAGAAAQFDDVPHQDLALAQFFEQKIFLESMVFGIAPLFGRVLPSAL